MVDLKLSPTAQTPMTTGDHAPWFRARALSGSPRYVFDSVAGRLVVMLFMGSAAHPAAAAALEQVRRHRHLFDDDRACFFGVTTDPQDEQQGRIAQSLPGVRFFMDDDGAVSRLYGALAGADYRPHWLLLEPSLQVAAAMPLSRSSDFFALLEQRLATPTPDEPWAPVLQVPHLFSPEFCRTLIDGYEAHGGRQSGFMREVDGKTVLVVDAAHKQRRDWSITDPKVQGQINAGVLRVLAPAIERSFQFTPTRIERHIVACYEAGAGHFRPHRDNTTKGTAHRRFAVTINLNADYDGGELRFPEFGQRTYRAPPGGAIVFSCSLLHEATPVTRGRRYATLPFLYDEAAASLREANIGFIAEGGSYKAKRPDPGAG
jgi:predicted 2-oxoglutarate/Fe(II)-dependent dioxygenase YbiX/peroxiredoxin